MKKALKVLSILMLMLVFVACGGEKKAAEEKAPIYVGTNAEFPPFEYLDGDKIVGFDIDFINAIGKEMGREIIVKDMSFDGLLPALQTKKVDVVVAGMTATEERQKTVNFSQPYYSANQVIIVPEGNTTIADFNDLNGKKVAVMLGFTGDVVVSEMPGVEVERFNAAYAGIMALQSGKVDAVVLDSETANNYVAKNSGLKIAEGKGESEDYAIAVRKEDSQLLEEINAAIDKIKADGTFSEIIEKHFN
ncbi:basic amino acid ABC transporter substrate-binding protein [Fusobacterium perfoetens]|uniref:basic amino acid ABC transporter substrate-binding protein n=1 Tax=Fusobacterium perfoetens TaxID=852 RepID=UPI001F26AEAF|nr:basic amino acid ABC transporter substrate-binding protein [Fusobacterium perfoetens]MCF2625003.1 basic amino acid ABC transporter substrate-binding protein [Fusobacterium perfoetens]